VFIIFLLTSFIWRKWAWSGGCVICVLWKSRRFESCKLCQYMCYCETVKYFRNDTSVWRWSITV